MSIFGDLMDRIRGHEARKMEAKTNAAVAANAPAADTPSLQKVPSANEPVDIQAVLEDMSAQSKQKLDWQHSIVDLMKLVGMDSGLEQRKALAQELGYTGDTNDTAPMNIWLQKQVMQKMAANGGKVPAELM